MKMIILTSAVCLLTATAAQAGGTVTVAVAPNVTMTAGGPSPGISGIDAATASIIQSQIPHKKQGGSKSASQPSYAMPQYDEHPYAGKTVINPYEDSKVNEPKRSFDPQ